ncbi:MAG: thiamine-phosphate kinase [Archangium sp.]
MVGNDTVLAMNEFELIQTFVAQFQVPKSPAGPGDDCAVVGKRGASCVTTDALVEDVHFTRTTFSFEDIGHKALAVNLSDLAAMGARADWFTVAFGLPENVDAKALTQIGRGMSALAQAHRATLIGGNVTSARQLSITITASGVLDGAPLLRAKAKPGDGIYVSGPIGNAAAGLDCLRDGRDVPALVEAQRRPAPHFAFSKLAKKFASAGIDVSDGLAQDLGHLCKASKVGAELWSSMLPMTEQLLLHAGEQALDRALTGGEDYVLLVTVPRRRCMEFEVAMQKANLFCARVGEIVRGESVTLDGRPLRGRLGFQHRT